MEPKRYDIDEAINLPEEQQQRCEAFLTRFQEVVVVYFDTHGNAIGFWADHN